MLHLLLSDGKMRLKNICALSKLIDEQVLKKPLEHQTSFVTLKKFLNIKT